MKLLEPTEAERQKLVTLIHYQFGKELAENFAKLDYTVTRSKATRKIRHVFFGETIIFTFRPQSGLLALTIHGGKYIHENSSLPKNRVVLIDEVIEFISKGKTLFAKHVCDAYEHLNVDDEVLIVDKNDKLIAVGIAIISAELMISLEKGVAVKTRAGISKLH